MVHILPGLKLYKRLAAISVAAVLLGTAVAVYLAVRPAGDRFLAEPVTAAKRGAVLQHCTEGALLFHDVRWAAACMVLGEQGQGDGNADCDLPPALATRLYKLLEEAEQKCMAEVRGLR